METSRLREAIGRLSGRSVAARLRPLMPDIDRKVRDGVRHEDIVAALNAEGLTIGIETFRKNLYRYRSRCRPDAAPSAQLPSPDKMASDASGQDDGRGKTSAPYGPTAFETALDPKSRDELGEKYLARRGPLLATNRRDG